MLLAYRREEHRTPNQKGLRDRNSPTCTLSQNGYGDCSSRVFDQPASLLLEHEGRTDCGGVLYGFSLSGDIV